MVKKRVKQALCCLLLCAVLAPCATLVAAAASFSDVPAAHWAAEPVRRSVALGFFKGETPNRFGLGHQMTRGAFAVVLCRFFGWETEKVEKSVYTDVPADAWYAGAVETAYAHGAITLQSASYRPGEAITREELAVMLVRSLGYGTLAGLAQKLPVPFQDMTSNSGYLTVAYDLGLVGGTSATTFSPERVATREQAAVMLVRLYDRLHAPSPGKVGIAATAEELAALSGLEAVAVNAGRLIYQGKAQLTWTATEEQTAAVRSAAESAGVKQLLYVSGTESPLKASSAETAASLAEKVTGQGYDGLFLDVEQVTYAHRQDLVDLTAALRGELGDKLLYLAVPAPAWRGAKEEGYAYGQLASSVDRLVLRTASYTEKTDSGFPAAPMEPLEEVYFALGELRDEVDAGRLSLLLTTDAAIWTDGRSTGALSGTAGERFVAEKRLTEYYSNRYACAYASGTVDGRETVLWYLNSEAVSQRSTLAAFFGVDQLCFSNLNGLREDLTPAGETNG